MFNIKNEHLKTVKSILNNHVPGIEVRVYGSRVNGKAKSYSDLDLALVGQKKTSQETMMQLKEAFQNSDLPFRVDITDWHKTSQEFQKIISANCKVLNY